MTIRFYREFGWTPEELRRQPSSEVFKILAIWEVEGKIQKQRDAVKGLKGRKK